MPKNIQPVQNANGKWYVWLHAEDPRLPHNTIVMSPGFEEKDSSVHHAILLSDILGITYFAPKEMEE